MTPKQKNILIALSTSNEWMTREEMIPIAGKKGYSSALGTATKVIQENTLEHLGYVIRKNRDTPFKYKLSDKGRKAIARYLPDLATINENFEEAVKSALSESAIRRRARLEIAPKIPTMVVTQSVVYLRNADVVAEVLFNAKGHCGVCAMPAPFKRRTDKTPYLEVHHKIPLSVGGEDSVKNAIALCPNCHREAHFA